MLILTEYDVTIDGHQVLCCRRKVNFQSKSTSLIHMTPSLTFVWLGVALGHKPWWTPPRIYDRCFHSDINLINTFENVHLSYLCIDQSWVVRHILLALDCFEYMACWSTLLFLHVYNYCTIMLAGWAVWLTFQLVQFKSMVYFD